MRGDSVVANQRLMAQSINAMAEHISASTGYMFKPTAFADLPLPGSPGTISCVSDSTVNTWGSVVAGGGIFRVLAFYNGANWTVIGA